MEMENNRSSDNNRREASTKPLTMTIYGKEDRMRVGKRALTVLGDPDFVKVLVSENYDKLLFVPCEGKDPMSFHVPATDPKLHTRFRINSKAFVRDFLEKNGLDPLKTYRLYGSAHENCHAVTLQFNMKE